MLDSDDDGVGAGATVGEVPEDDKNASSEHISESDAASILEDADNETGSRDNVSQTDREMGIDESDLLKEVALLRAKSLPNYSSTDSLPPLRSSAEELGGYPNRYS